MSLDVVSVDVTVPAPVATAFDVVIPAPAAAIDVTVPPTAVVLVEVVVGPVGGGEGGAMTGTCGSVTPIPPGTTAFVGIGWSTNEYKAEFLNLVDGSLTDFTVSVGNQSIAPGTVVATLRRNRLDTALTVTLDGGSMSGVASAAEGAIPVDAFMPLVLKAVLSPTVPAGVILTASWRMVPA